MTKKELNPNDYRIGGCLICSVLVVRRAPANMAVCETCYNHNPQLIVEVPLMSPGQFLKDIGEMFFKDHAGQRGLIGKEKTNERTNKK